MSYLSFSRKLSSSLASAHHLDEEQQAVLAYAIEVITLNSVNTLLTLTLGWILDVFWPTAICLGAMTVLKYHGGGGHSESPWRCTLVTMLVFPLLALAAARASNWPLFYRDLISLIAVTAGSVSIIKYAPVDNDKAPIVSPERRMKLKKRSLITIILLATVMAVLRFITLDETGVINLCLSFSIFWFSFNLTPSGHRLWRFLDGLGQTEERRCSS